MSSSGAPLQAEDGRIAGLDGVRALAVLLVMTVHLYLVGCGWIGVQLFFVLSGFLITRILLAAKDRGGGAGRYFGQFYLRRSLRIFPAYYAYLLLVFGAAALRHAGNVRRLAAMASTCSATPTTTACCWSGPCAATGPRTCGACRWRSSSTLSGRC